MSELTPDLLRRVMCVMQFDNCDGIWWRQEDPAAHTGPLTVYARCDDFFSWGSSDLEPIETEADVDLLETCAADLRAASEDEWPIWIGELYAARRRNAAPASFMSDPQYKCPVEIFPKAAA